MTGVRRMEVLAALSSAGDLTMGQPMEHGLRSAVLAGRLAGLVGHPRGAVDDVLSTALLRWVGCTDTAPHALRLLGDDIVGRAALVAGALQVGAAAAAPVPDAEWWAMSRGHCYVAERLAERLGSSACVVRAVGQVFERWDGGGRPGGLGGEDLEPARGSRCSPGMRRCSPGRRASTGRWRCSTASAVATTTPSRWTRCTTPSARGWRTSTPPPATTCSWPRRRPPRLSPRTR